VALRVKADPTLWPAAAERSVPAGPIAPADAVVLRFAESGDVLDATETTRAVLNLAPDLLCGSGLFDRVHVADRVAYLCALAEMRSGAAGRRIELRLRLPGAAGTDGPDNFQPFAVDFCASANGIVAMLRGNRDMVQLRDALREATDRNDGAEIAKGRFLAAVSHELRTPLNAIIGFSEILLHELFGGFTDARQREYTALIKESGHHLLAVVNSILDVSKIESGTYAIQTEPFAFGEAAEMCRSMMSLQAERKQIDLRTQIPPSLGELVADRRAVQQMLINLVANAIKFTPEKGSVVVGAQRVGSRLHFWVADTGIGIDKDDLDRIGRPFMQVRNDYTRQFEGTGLGLSLVKGLVSLHEGTMSIESAPGEGTKVAISLPLAGPDRSQDCGGTTEPVVHKGGDYGALRKTA
jgi:cell cycle sensor histidine kinase DivJ